MKRRDIASYFRKYIERPPFRGIFPLVFILLGLIILIGYYPENYYIRIYQSFSGVLLIFLGLREYLNLKLIRFINILLVLFWIMLFVYLLVFDLLS